MEEARPTQLRMTWVEDGAPQKNSSPAEPCHMIVVDPLQTGNSSPCSTPLLDASWLQMSREEEEVVDSIQILASDLGQSFERYLTPCERTHIILAAMEVMTETTVFNKTAAEHILEVAMGDPDFWLMDVQKIVTCIYDSLKDIQKLAIWHCFDSLLMKMADKYPEEVVTTLLNIAPQGDSTALQLWGQIFYRPQIREKIFMVFVNLLRFLWMTNIPSSTAEGTCVPDMAFPSEDLGDKPDNERNQRHPRMVTASLLVGSLHMLSEKLDMASQMQVFLPDMMGVLQVGSADLKIKSLMFFKNVMGKPTTFQTLEEAVGSPITGQLMENLPLLFDSECSQLRELSICIFRDQLESVVGSNKRSSSYLRSVLIPLFFHMNDQSLSVAKASGEALLAAAKLLRWKDLKHLLETQQTRRIGKCLLVKDKSTAEEYLHQSLPYLKDPQATVREVAVTFIGGQGYSGSENSSPFAQGWAGGQERPGTWCGVFTAPPILPQGKALQFHLPAVSKELNRIRQF
ncbi:unnamed protein product [Coccothraustes coccothraustes]